ncbi:ABC transporter ATP-binding protein [Pseudochelatococcus contaminans]|uniref:Iron complex transport system ATP-binding protein n=1 Tax=Pseudochelatococcus contaminans TaxID=1538103 RepID=A0A7W5Z4W4_9HYPH|nr:ABC transporter ATP-binding protein [Pseudochelatococcus contaminans]MBB3810248.1 iron complex transport system ATP-binding protein [Pseudochelatococcus contaminans]
MSRPDAERPPDLTASNLTIAYGNEIIVDDLALSIPGQAFTALIGPNGSGKSTILRALAGLLNVGNGAVMLDGQSIARLGVKDLARRIGMLAQGPVPPEGLTVLDLVKQGRYPHRSLFGRWRREDDDACEEALHLTNMEELRNRALESLSGGQRQRAWIAMALAQETPILLLDEPTTFLDLAHQIEVMELIADLVDRRGKTIVAVLHDLNQAARYADYMVMLKAGSILAKGDPNEVMTASMIERVFGVVGNIVPDPVTGTPLCIPLAPRRDRARNRTGNMLRSDNSGGHLT